MALKRYYQPLLYNRNQTYTEQYLELQMSNQNLSVILYSPRKYNIIPPNVQWPIVHCQLYISFSYDTMCSLQYKH